MGPLLLLPLLWGGSLQELPGFELRVQESVTVQACMDVYVSCAFSYPWSSGYWPPEPSIYWFREGDTPHDDAVATNDLKKRVKPQTWGRFRLVGDSRDNDCSLIIKEARLSDSGAYYLRVENAPNEKYSYLDKKLNLQVTEKPNIQFLEPLESGRPTKLTCSLSLACDDRHPLLFSWVGDALDAMDLNTIHSPELTLTPRPQDHDSKLTCRVTLQGLQVTLERTVQLNVSYAPRNVRISLSFRNVTELSVFYSCSPAYGVHLPLLRQPVFITCCLPGFLLGLPPSFTAFGALPPWRRHLDLGWRCGHGTPAAAPETLHSLQLTPTPRPRTTAPTSPVG